MMTNQNIPCPACGTAIQIEINQLLSGTQFSCPSCGSLIGLASEGQPLVQEMIDKLEEIKNNSSKKPDKEK
ncbi:putative RNA-binding Zn-ribbon protein involved in translation (DUF1610 family) [Chryseobacterium sp. H1D6B]|uniref:hypothetical protein n=1 Tax=Chryseobacterium sp. H1D6B TaxID=2940588 RepID=UPI0015CEDE56|nr:hypothetical protein [Chryseobacterium sp. H1D6B]MDH6253450.1 putative RNA-binding Zn-ribbon protein involved in translation (DUF1610 family) [Chryseobacterium sp. H1D6B]